MFRRIYVEITNICNLNCGFCPGTRRAPRMMTAEEFRLIAGRLRGWTNFVYLHVLGEPLLHPQLGELIEQAAACGLRTILTTNGTLLRERGEMLLGAPGLHRVNISLQAYEGNAMADGLEAYIAQCAHFCGRAAGKGILCSLRLWNGGGAQRLNGAIVELLRGYFPQKWEKGAFNETLAPRVFLERAQMFEWPDMDAGERGSEVFCHGLRDQLAVLCDGTVVPCCLDHEGDIALGNLFEAELAEILASERASAIYEGFSRRRAVEPLCRRCGYARRF